MLLERIPRLHGFDVKTPGLTSFCGRLYSQKVAQSTPASTKCLKHCRGQHHGGILSVLGISVGAWGLTEILPVCITAGEMEETACLYHDSSASVQCLCSLLWAYWELCASLHVLLQGRGNALEDSVIPAWHAATARLMVFSTQEQSNVTLLENSGLCGLLLQVQSWLASLLQKFVCNTYPECICSQHTMEEVT